MDTLAIAFAFAGGLVSFLSPCVLPLIPAFLAYLAGTSISESGTRRRDIFLASLFFVFGFSLVFSVVGVTLNTLLDRAAYDMQIWLSRIGGAVVIVFGLFLMGLIKIPFLEARHALTVKRQFRSRYITSFVFGATFAAGWTPCVGAVLGGILGLAATAPGSAFTLLFSYSLGLGLPFLVVGIFASQATAWITRIVPYLRIINIFFGALIVVLGILAFTQKLSLVANLEILNQFLLR
ncbi:MAG: hypothetical protein A2934_05445 [Candidatus Sungbacteria bacterium RIFCSPLOWO2_01_FULL_47_10]|uniref:Cytochrome C biogenesis protein transmembrane domain-containing protein n=1 Tax=Candidatus Sungbacteria bacterium RIFCSPLOWO2_01_FULL_47_10 TaxID=1802276 RepID=A0A1G2L425_9BACT|nr:MAG: hypothetical protein A2934_05445 [Candidatus Sungbacteria bacterium RIFCSPLOWO2_01_FULL_47_10]